MDLKEIQNLIKFVAKAKVNEVKIGAIGQRWTALRLRPFDSLTAIHAATFQAPQQRAFREFQNDLAAAARDPPVHVARARGHPRSGKAATMPPSASPKSRATPAKRQ